MTNLNSVLSSNYMKSTLYYIKDQFENGTQATRRFALNLTKTSSLIALISSIAFTILGASWSSKGLGFIIGFPIIWGGVTVSYLSYNVYQLSKNLQQINENPKNYKAIFAQNFDSNRVKNCLRKDTICFDMAVNWVSDLICKKSW